MGTHPSQTLYYQSSHERVVTIQQSSQFQKVLTEQIAIPEMRSTAMGFLTLLVQSWHTDKVPLLEKVIKPLAQEPETVEQLLNQISLSRIEVVNVLQQYLKDLCKKRQFPSSHFTLLERYLTNLTASSIQTRFTYTFLTILTELNKTLPAHLQPYVAFWSTISEFFHAPVIKSSCLRNVGDCIRQAPIPNDIEDDLIEAIKYLLIKHVRTEIDLKCAIEHLGPTLVKSTPNKFGKELLLLQEMANLVGKYNRKPIDIAKTVVYIKVILGEMDDISYLGLTEAEQEYFIDSCLNSLLAGITVISLTTLSTNQWWPEHIIISWKQYIDRLSNKSSTNSIQKTSSVVSQLPASVKAISNKRKENK